jgi:hypothetical protein
MREILRCIAARGEVVMFVGHSPKYRGNRKYTHPPIYTSDKSCDLEYSRSARFDEEIHTERKR